jgi:site-specific DNA recombinase
VVPRARPPVIIDRAVWEQAQHVGAEHATSRDPAPPGTEPAAVFPYRSRVRCRDCRRRMFRAAYGRGAHSWVCYQCPHNANNPQYAASHPGHPRTVKIREDLLDQVVAAFFRDRIFGTGRAALLTATDAAADRDTQTAAPTARLWQLDTGMGSCVLELEQLPADTAAAALRARFAEPNFRHLPGGDTTARSDK